MQRKDLADLFRNKEAKDQNLADLSLFNENYPEFIAKILEYIPEANKLNSEANASAEKQGEAKSGKDFYGQTNVKDEFIRGMSGLLRFKDVINQTTESYEKFVECQREMKKPVLDSQSFLAMQKHINQTLSTPEDYASLVWSILCNDLGKVHSLVEEYKKVSGDKLIGHDGILAEMLSKQPELFPGFNTLPEKLQKQIIDGYASGCDISMLEQLELPPQALIALLSLDKQTLERYILHTIYDVAGAAAAFKPKGSLTMHEETWNFFDTLRTILMKLHQEKPISLDEAYEEYVTYRGEKVGIPNKDAESLTLIRIAGLSRLATEQHGVILKAAWDELTRAERATLIKELNTHGGGDRRAIFVGYGVAMLVNPQVALKPIYGNVINKEGLKIGLKYLAQSFALAREQIGDDKSDELFVAECATVASALSKNPREFVYGDKLTREFTVIAPSDGRRMDFALAPAIVLQNKASDKAAEEKPLISPGALGVFATANDSLAVPSNVIVPIQNKL